MLIIEENTLTHVDSVSDVIEHYGKKGMKWGVRKMSKLQSRHDKYKEISKSRKKAIKGSVPDLHRAKTKRAVVGTLLYGPIGGGIGYATTGKKSLQKSANRYERKANKTKDKMKRLKEKHKLRMG